MRNAEISIIVSAYSDGENRELSAFENAFKSPFFKPFQMLDFDKIICGFEFTELYPLSIESLENIHGIIDSKISKTTEFSWTADYSEEELNGKMRVTVVASITKH